MSEVIHGPRYADAAYNLFVYENFTGSHVPKLARPDFEAACGARIARNLADAHHPMGQALDLDDLDEPISFAVSLWQATEPTFLGSRAWVVARDALS